MNATIATHNITFKQFLLHDKRNKTILLIVAIIVVLQFSIFKYFYPFAGFIHGDSFVYIDAAFWNLDTNNYMVGYSRFLRLFSVFTRSDFALVAFQYLFIQSSVIAFLFSLFYFYKPNKVIQIILLCFMVLNPLFLYMANYVSSDAYFLALSLTWFTLLIWIIHRPSVPLLIAHTIVIYIAFTVRNNALIYPIIAAFVFIVSRQRISQKILGISASTILISMFILYTGYKFKELTGTWQYSPFSGWQLANNGMYAYRYVDSAHLKPVPFRFRQLDKEVRTYFDSTRNILKYPNEALLASTVYMWYPKSPLNIYMNRQFDKDSTSSRRKKWAAMAPLYSDYGSYLIKQYPYHFARYFLWPNATKYYALPLEFLEFYNMNLDTVAPIAQEWFGYKSRKVVTRLKTSNVPILEFYPIFSGIMNTVFICSFFCFLILKGFRHKMLLKKGVLLAGILWLTNAVFTIFASSAALRFQAFPLLVMSTFALLLIDWLFKVEREGYSLYSKVDYDIHENINRQQLSTQ